jgi:hypothetical protein
MTTALQIAANQRNAQKSTGPRTEEGKKASRANALEHGLAGESDLAPPGQVEAMLKRCEEWRATLAPGNAVERDLVTLAAGASLRAEWCMLSQCALIDRMTRRAELSWDEDRQIAAEELAAGLPRRPALVRRQLEATVHGCDWLMERWQQLAYHLEGGRAWDESHRALALDLLGVAPELRDGPTPIDPDGVDNPRMARIHVATNEIKRLTACLGRALRLDEDDRQRALMGMGEPDRAFKLAQRYEAAANRQLYRALAQYQRLHSAPGPAAPAAPAPPEPAAAPPEPAAPSRPEPEPSPVRADTTRLPEARPAAPAIKGFRSAAAFEQQIIAYQSRAQR